LDPHVVAGAGRARRFVEGKQIGVSGDRGVAEVVRPLRERRVARRFPSHVARVPDVERRRVVEVVAQVNVIGERATRERDGVAVRDQPRVIRDLRQAVIGILIRIEDVTGDLIEHAEPRRGQRFRHVAVVDRRRDIGWRIIRRWRGRRRIDAAGIVIVRRRARARIERARRHGEDHDSERRSHCRTAQQAAGRDLTVQCHAL